MYIEETKRRRAADREGRRMRRRRKREVEGTHASHHDGMSSDDEETEIDSRQFKSESGITWNYCNAIKAKYMAFMFTLYRPLAAQWNAAQPGGQNNRFQLPREQKSFNASPRAKYFPVRPSNSVNKYIIFYLFLIERIIHQSKNIFEDVVDNFSSINAVKLQFERWKDQCGDSYKNAYISLCLPKLFTMFTRIELIEWNPLCVSTV